MVKYNIQRTAYFIVDIQVQYEYYIVLSGFTYECECVCVRRKAPKKKYFAFRLLIFHFYLCFFFTCRL